MIRLLSVLFLLAGATSQAFAESPPIRLGWQVPWATQGQLVMALKHTNIPEIAGVELDYAGFSYGGPLNKAALAGQVDVLLTADQPAMVLVSRDPNFRIVSRMMYNRVCIYVPPVSPIQSLSELKGRVVMGPIGAAAERVALAALGESGVAIDEVRLGQLDMAQQSAMLSGRTAASEWPGVDALFGFDPLPAVFVENETARLLDCGNVVSVVVAHRDMIETRTDDLARFLKAFKMSWYAFATRPADLNRLFSRDSRLEVSDRVLDDAASVEPNRWVSSLGEMRFTFTDGDLATFEQSNQFLLSKGILSSPLDMDGAIDVSLVGSPDTEPSVEEIDAIKLSDDAGE